MKLRYVSWTKVSVLSAPFLAASLLAAANGWAQDTLGTSAWKLQATAPRGRITYSIRGEMRKGSDYTMFNSHEDGLIGDVELKAVTERATRAQAFSAMSTAPTPGAPAASTPTSGAFNQALAQFVLSRVLDHEAAKRRVPREVSDLRVNYVMSAIFTQNAISKGKIARIPDDRAVGLYGAKVDPATHQVEALYQPRTLYSNVELFAWLRETVGENRARFNMDWKFEKAGMSMDRANLMKARAEISWPKITLSFDSMPSTVEEFRDQIRLKLQPTQDALLRNALWRQLLQERTNLSVESLSAVQSDQIQAIYHTLKESTFQVENTRAEVLELRVSGVKSDAFKNRFMTLLDERQESLTHEVLDGPYGPPKADPVAGAPSPAEDAKLRARIVELRRQIPGEILAQVRGEMARDLAAGSLALHERTRTLEHSGGDEINAELGLESSELAAVMNPAFAIMSLFPRMDAQDTDGSTLIVLLRNQENSDPSYLPKTDPRVMQVLKTKARSRVMGRAFRKLAWQLLNENRVEIFDESCRFADCPLAQINLRSSPQIWADALFPETLYPGVAPTSESSLVREERFVQVFSISLDAFTTALEL